MMSSQETFFSRGRFLLLPGVFWRVVLDFIHASPSYIISDDAWNIMIIASSPYPTASKLHSSTTLRKKRCARNGRCRHLLFFIGETAGHMG